MLLSGGQSAVMDKKLFKSKERQKKLLCPYGGKNKMMYRACMNANPAVIDCLKIMPAGYVVWQS